MKYTSFVSKMLILAAATGIGCAATPIRAAQALPPTPKGVTDLKFSDFFVSPVGPRGLELTSKLKALDGKRVRILGYMVRQEHEQHGSFLLTPVPVQLHDHDSALADDLPPATMRVIGPSEKPILYTPQLLLLTGTLSVGNREEPDGRISMVRLTLDPNSSSRRKEAHTSSRGGASALMNSFRFQHQ